jgi:DNA-binding beta-propeller fold protein YncE
MRKLIILSFLLFFLKLSSAVKLESVFETSDVGEYNQWVSEHKGEYPELKPVYILGERTGVKEGIKTPTGKTRIYEYRLYYYDDNGNLVNTEDLSGHEMKVTFSPDHDRVIIREWRDVEPYGSYFCTVKDKYGNVLFEKRTGMNMITPTPLEGIYLSELSYHEAVPPEPVISVFDENGKTIGELKDILGFYSREGEILVSRDNKLLFFGGTRGLGGNPDCIILMDDGGNEISFKDFVANLNNPNRIEVMGLRWSADEDIEKIAVGFNGVVYVYDRNWNFLHEWEVPSRAHPSVGLSPDGEYMATFGAKTVCFFDLKGDSLMWKKRLEEAGRAKYVKVLPESKGVVVGTKWPAWVYLLNNTGEVVKYTDLGSKEIQKYVKGVPIKRKLYEPMIYKIDISSGNIVIKVFNRPDTSLDFYSKVWKLGEE